MNVRYFFFDLIAVIVFAVLARLAHQTPEMPFGLSGIAETAWPFLLGTLLGWIVLALARRTAEGRGAVGSSFGDGAVVWICTVLVGLAIWGLRHNAVPHWSFIIVASVMSALLLFGWRGIMKFTRK